MAQERNRFRTVLLAGVVAVLGLGAIGAVQAQGFFNDMRGGPGFGGQMAGHMLDRALGSVDASDAQRAEIADIMDEAKAQIRAVTDAFEDFGAQARALLAAQTIDRAAFETLRQEALAAGDAMSALAMEAVLDAAEVLTPEQRAGLIENQSRFGHGFGRGFGPNRN